MSVATNQATAQLFLHRSGAVVDAPWPYQFVYAVTKVESQVKSAFEGAQLLVMDQWLQSLDCTG